MFNLTGEISTDKAIYLMNAHSVDLINFAQIQIVSPAAAVDGRNMLIWKNREKITRGEIFYEQAVSRSKLIL